MKPPRPLHLLTGPSLAALLLASSLCAQSVAHTDLSVPNPESYGSATLKARLYYPAKSSGTQPPIELAQGPRGAIVFLAGYSFTGRDYDQLGRAIAARGYLAIMNESGSFNGALLGDDGKAWFKALAQETQRKSSFLHAAVDIQRLALLGHSMGGANVYRVLAEQPGYRVGAAIAPLAVPSIYPPKVTRPLAVIAGAGDLTTPWASHAKPSWDAVSGMRGTKLFYLLDANAHHLNVAFAGFPGATATDQAVFDRTADVSLSFVQHYLDGPSDAFDHCVGKEARSAKHLKQLWSVVRDPVLFEAGTARLGFAHEIVTSGEPGVAVQLIAASTSQLATPMGAYLLDPVTTMVLHVVQTSSDGLGRFAWTVPNQPQFAGIILNLQGLCSVRGGGFAFSNALRVVIQP